MYCLTGFSKGRIILTSLRGDLSIRVGENLEWVDVSKLGSRVTAVLRPDNKGDYILTIIKSGVAVLVPYLGKDPFSLCVEETPSIEDLNKRVSIKLNPVKELVP